MFEAINNAWRSLTSDPVLAEAEKHLDHANRVHLGEGLIIDPDALHKGARIGEKYEFGYNKLENVSSIFQGEIDGRYVHKCIMKPLGKIGVHSHKKGNDEHWKVSKGSVRLMWGHELEFSKTLTSGQTQTIPGELPHAAAALTQGVEAEFSIDKID